MEPLAKTYRIETERLVIRCYEPGDASKLHEAIIRSLDHLRPWLPWVQQEPKPPEARAGLIRLFRGQFDLGLDYAFGIFDKEEMELVGSTGLHTRIGRNAREIGYWIGIDHIGRGYATEAVSALVKTGFDIEGISRIEIRCAPENTRSQHVPQKLGFKMENIVKRILYQDMVETMIWSMTKKEYASSLIRHLQIKAFDLTGSSLLFP